MDEYFSSTLDKLKSNNYGELSIILGNESCDLDSAVSSLVYAIFLHWQYQQIKCKVCTKINRDEDMYKDDIFVPILNVDRDDFGLKTEVVYFFNEHGITAEKLVFRNDLDLQQLVTTKKAKVVLVDHHTLSNSDKFLAPFVIEIIDHRPIDKSAWGYKEDTRSTIETVGSCCTLIAQRIKDLATLVAKDVDFFNAYPVCSDMLHSTIILDTVNFSKDLNKATPHDEDIILFLETLLKPSDYETERKNKLDRLSTAKSDVSSLTAAQLLKKDVKIFGSVLVPSFPILVQEFLQKPEAQRALSEALNSRGCSVALLLGMDYKEGMKRDTAVYSDNAEKETQLSAFIEQWASPPLGLTPLAPPLPCHYYKQDNLTATRKQYIPAINEFLNDKRFI
ncbi:exopolyphosphatase PRUNE1 [Ostrinia nubilalis]|uniref:exopolyphosphatase PRUNE1 n=1 Tax=Ostrinia nubilalis TaxID=29057 RepID=UPI0030824C0D